MAGILLSRQKLHDYLTGLAHTATEGTIVTETGTYRLWRTPWGYLFMVPDDDFMCATWELQDIIDVIDKTKPTIH